MKLHLSLSLSHSAQHTHTYLQLKRAFYRKQWSTASRYQEAHQLTLALPLFLPKKKPKHRNERKRVVSNIKFAQKAAPSPALSPLHYAI